MDSEKRYRDQADACRERAAVISDREAASAWLKIAEEYDRLADAVAPARREPGGEPSKR